MQTGVSPLRVLIMENKNSPSRTQTPFGPYVNFYLTITFKIIQQRRLGINSAASEINWQTENQIVTGRPIEHRAMLQSQGGNRKRRTSALLKMKIDLI